MDLMNGRRIIRRNLGLLLITAVAVAPPTFAASIFDILKSKPATNQSPAITSTNLAGLSQDQMASGLKEALDKGLQQAVTTLGQSNGFLQDVKVKIPMPESLQTVEKTLRKLKQDKLADDFVATMNHAAEQAVPEAATVLGDSLKQMSVTDAASILLATNNAATQYFRRTSETNLYGRFLPIVKTATTNAGVTSAYKRMTEAAAGGGTGTFGALGGLLSRQMPDLDDYVTHKALDGLFFKIAEQEKLIRENPVARTTDLLQKVFGAIGKATSSSPAPAPPN